MNRFERTEVPDAAYRKRDALDSLTEKFVWCSFAKSGRNAVIREPDCWAMLLAKVGGAAWLSVAISLGATFPTCAADYSGKTINLIVGLGPGGGYDTYMRLLGRHIGRHLPGDPRVTVQNMPGAGGLRAASYIYNVAPKDGTALAMFGPSAAIEPLLGNPQAQFDTERFAWIGNMNKDVLSCGAWRSSGLSSWRDVQEHGARFGGTGPYTIATQHALVLKNVLGANVTVVQGYSGTMDVNLAMQRREVDATCGMFLSSVRGPYSQYIKSGDLKIVIQFGRVPEPEFGNAADIYDLVKSADEKKLLDFIFMPTAVSRPVIAPPGLPEDVVSSLQRGFIETMKDPALQAEAKALGLDVGYQDGKEVGDVFRQIVSTPRTLVERAKYAISSQSGK